ncbi:MAG: hypothetical protein MZV64_03140 [Ignavibacteriales bacterium]|nr:hypothetical protein [Ignavibacteriales bacterium]
MLGERKTYYSGDIGSDEDLNLFKDQKPGIIITEATHIKWESVLDFIETNQPEKLYLTHLSDELEFDLKQRIDSLPILLREKIVLAFDGLCLKF